MLSLALVAAGCANRPGGVDAPAPRVSPAPAAAMPAATPAATSAALPLPPALPPGRAVAVAPGVYLVPGAEGEVGPENRGRIGNTGFIVGPRGVLAIDAGVSRRQGEALLAEVARVTDRPVRALLLTHTRQEFLFGAGAFLARGIPVTMEQAGARLMAARCEGCLKTLRQTLGEDEMRGTALPRPDAVIDASRPGQLQALGERWSEAVGRPLRLLYHGHGSGPGDLALLDVESATLFAGGLADLGHVPDVQDSRLDAWAAALEQLQGLPLRHVVPGHGPPGPPAVLAEVKRYLVQLEARVGALLARGAALSEVADLADLPDFRQWAHYDTIHRRNASIVYLRLEREELLR